MTDLNKKPINLNDYKIHARVLEVRLLTIRMLFVNHYGEGKGMEMIKDMVDMLGCTWELLAPVFTNVPNVRKGAGDFGQLFTKQEIILASHIFGEDRVYVAKKYLRASKSYIYQKAHQHNPEEYVDEAWLAKLDRNPVVIKNAILQKAALDFCEKYQTFVQMIQF